MNRNPLGYHVVATTLIATLAAASIARATAASVFTYQGQLKSEGVPVNATCDMVFSLWDHPLELDPAVGRVGEPIQFNDDPSTEGPVEVVDGFFVVRLDFGVAAFGTDDRWLDIQIDCVRGDDTPLMPLSPRQLVTAAPYSISTRGIHVDGSGRVGIGTTAPTSALHLRTRDDLIGLRLKTPNSWTAELRQTDASFLSLINGGSERLTVKYNGNVGIGVPDPSARLDVDGHLKVNGDVIVPPTTRYLMVSGADMVPRKSSMQVYRGNGDVVSFFTPPGQDTVLDAPIHLPDGAEITELRAFMSDSAPDQDATVQIARFSRTGGLLTLAVIRTQGSSGFMEEYIDDTIENPVIDNSTWAYHLVVQFTVPPDDGEMALRIRPVRIAYTVDRLLP